MEERVQMLKNEANNGACIGGWIQAPEVTIQPAVPCRSGGGTLICWQAAIISILRISDKGAEITTVSPLSLLLNLTHTIMSTQSKFTSDQTQHIARFLPAILAKSESLSSTEFTAYKDLIKNEILKSPPFVGVPEADWEKRILKKFANTVNRRTEAEAAFFFHPLSGIQLFEKEHRVAILAKIQETDSEAARSADNHSVYESRKLEMWNGLGKPAQDTYEVRAALHAINIETNQIDFARATTKALTTLCNGGKVGHLEIIAHFAFRTPDGDLECGVYDISPHISALIHGHGAENVPDFEGCETFSERWIQFAESAIARAPHQVGSGGDAEFKIHYNLAGVPMFPSVDMKRVTADNLISLLTTYLAQVWASFAERKAERTGPGSKWSQAQDYDTYYDKSIFIVPVKLRAPETMTPMEIFTLAQFFAETSTLGAPNPFSFNPSPFSPTPPTIPLEKAAFPKHERSKGTVESISGSWLNPVTTEKRKRSQQEAPGGPNEESIAARRASRQPANKKAKTATISTGKRPGYDIALYTADDVQVGVIYHTQVFLARLERSVVRENIRQSRFRKRPLAIYNTEQQRKSRLHDIFVPSIQTRFGMALVHHGGRQSSLKTPRSHIFQELIQQTAPFSDQPPHKRPRPEPPQRKRTFAAMMTQPRWEQTNLRTLLWLNDERTIGDLQAELEAQFLWHLDETLNLPVCRDEERCGICERYLRHVTLRRDRADDEEPGSEEEALINDNKGSEDDGTGDEADDDAMEGSQSESGSTEEIKSEGMRKLFRLRDLIARRDSFDADDDERAMGQLEGMMSTLQTDKLRADADCAHANAGWAVAQAELEALKKSHDALTSTHQELMARYQSTVDENTALKKQLQSALASCVWQCPDLSAAEWLAMQKPTPHDLQLLACWLQFHEHIVLPGVPLHDHYAIDLRDLRGYREVTARLPKSTAKASKPERVHRQRCLMAIIKVLAVPGRYSELVHINNYAIAAGVLYSPLLLQETSTEEDVAHGLASQGLTTATADDAWQYSYNIVLLTADSPPHGTDTGGAIKDEAVSLRTRIKAKLDSSPKPAGINPPAQDKFARPQNLPYKRVRH
ncbi:hypothetical protein B0H12DRAFT_1066906 [Mycena haematopus]|nr:hypothetical protein B0H12DRAFT_1066906 [Mycena haematopus]